MKKIVFWIHNGTSQIVSAFWFKSNYNNIKTFLKPETLIAIKDDGLTSFLTKFWWNYFSLIAISRVTAGADTTKKFCCLPKKVNEKILFNYSENLILKILIYRYIGFTQKFYVTFFIFWIQMFNFTIFLAKCNWFGIIVRLRSFVSWPFNN